MNVDVEQARHNLPLPRLMEQHGDIVLVGDGVYCPFCEPGKKKASASLQEKNGRWWFKCFSTTCRSGTDKPKGAWDEVAYLAWKTGLSRKEAFIAYLKEAGVWKAPDPGRGRPVDEPKEEPPREEKQEHPADEGQRFPDEPPPLNPPAENSPARLSEAPGETAPVVTPGPPVTAGTDTPPSEFQQEGEQKAPPPKQKGPWCEFHEALTLTDADKELIWRKRGLPESACAFFGFKSSPRSNEQILFDLRKKYDEDELVEAGLWKKEENGKCRPQPQLCGYGNTGRKDEKGELIWGWVHPILIPYFDKDGNLLVMRPHKGGIPGAAPRLFVARPAWGIGPIDGKVCVVTEGEFKACALSWVFEGKVRAAALPGISQAKNYTVMEDLKEWLATGPRPEIIVSFDNEEKGNLALPGFKPDKRKRYDAEIWARYLAIVLKREFGECLIARLPNEWRDEKGKADWDGRLAALMNAV